MGQKKLFIPATQEVPWSTLLNADKSTLATRQILDPAFDKFDPSFQWRDYVDLEIKNKETQEIIEKTLDQFALTPEGQQLLRQANALQDKRYKLMKIVTKFDPTITPAKKVSIKDGFYFLSPGSTITATGIIEIDRNALRGIEYLGQDGKYYDFSMQHMLFHELLHLADPVPLAAQQELVDLYLDYQKAKQEGDQKTAGAIKRLQEERQSAIKVYQEQLFELPTINTTNAFMRRYYNEPERALDHGAGNLEWPFLGLITAQKELGADHFYDEIEVPTVPAASGTSATKQR